MSKLIITFILLIAAAIPINDFNRTVLDSSGLNHSFSDSGQLLKTTTYHEGIILSQIEYIDPPLVKLPNMDGISRLNYFHNDLPAYGKLINEEWVISEKQEFLNIFKNLKFTERKPCNISLTSKELNTNGDNCDLPTADKLGLFIKTKATWIDISHLSYSKNIINKIPTLFVFISSIDKEDHPYMVIYQFNFPLDNVVTQFYGPFLNGVYHRINKVNDNDTLFIKYDSCMECHPWVYLQAIQFSAEKNIGVPLHFNYQLGEPYWSPRMEYELPGMGHSVGGTVETRVTRTGPFSIIQKFSLYKDDKIEWWGFDCKSFRCKTDIRKNDLPKDWGNGWKTGKKI